MPRLYHLLRSLAVLLISCFLISGCIKNLSTKGPVTDDVLPMCFDLKFKLGKTIKTSKVCFDSLRVCNHVLNVTKKYGSLGDITDITECGDIRVEK